MYNLGNNTFWGLYMISLAWCMKFKCKTFDMITSLLWCYFLHTIIRMKIRQRLHYYQHLLAQDKWRYELEGEREREGGREGRRERERERERGRVREVGKEGGRERERKRETMIDWGVMFFVFPTGYECAIVHVITRKQTITSYGSTSTSSSDTASLSG